MMKRSDWIWTVIGLAAVVFSCYLLYKEIRTISLDELQDSLHAIRLHNWLMAAGATLGAYFALAWYDRIAIAHLGKKISWWFITLCSFTTYALAHNIGASVFSGAVVRYRAYRSKGLAPQDIGVLIVFCSFTFALGVLLSGGAVLICQPELIRRVADVGPWLSVAIAFGLCSWIYLEYSWTEEAFWPPQLAGLLFSIAGMVIGTLLPQFKRNDNGMLVAQPQ